MGRKRRSLETLIHKYMEKVSSEKNNSVNHVLFNDEIVNEIPNQKNDIKNFMEVDKVISKEKAI